MTIIQCRWAVRREQFVQLKYSARISCLRPESGVFCAEKSGYVLLSLVLHCVGKSMQKPYGIPPQAA